MPKPKQAALKKWALGQIKSAIKSDKTGKPVSDILRDLVKEHIR